MSTWILVVYLSVGWGQGATGGPISIDGFSSYDKCQTAGNKFSVDMPKYDWHKCIEVVK